MKVPVINQTGKEIKTIDLPADIFEVEVNMGLMHQAYVRQMANARLGTHKTQRRGEVSLQSSAASQRRLISSTADGAPLCDLRRAHVALPLLLSSASL